MQQPETFLENEDGNATIEFVIMFPIIIAFFLMAFEAGFYMIRTTMLERSVDMAVRDLRLGTPIVDDPEVLRQMVCARSMLLPKCSETLILELQPIDTDTWAGVTDTTRCINRDLELSPVLQANFERGTGNDLMYVRVCAMADPFFPTTGLGARLARTAEGEYANTAISVFVNEPS